MRLYQAGALLTGAHSELIPDAGVLVDGTRIVAAGMDNCPHDAYMPGGWRRWRWWGPSPR
jgi:hypothetical protein